MKLSKVMMLGVFLAISVALFASASSAREEHEQKKIKILNEAAAALLKINPELSAALSKLANEEATKMDHHKKKMMLKAKKEIKLKAAQADAPKDSKEKK